jgi:SRSO17 transposase
VQLQRFLTDALCDDRSLWDQLAREAKRHLKGKRTCLVIEDLMLAKKGRSSVGVGRQVDPTTGKRGNFQALVSLSLALKGKVIPVALRLVLTQEWSTDLKNRNSSETSGPIQPDVDTASLGKEQICLETIRRLRDLDVDVSSVVAPRDYNSAYFRMNLDKLKLKWVLNADEGDVFFPEKPTISALDVKRAAKEFGSHPETIRDIVLRKSGSCRYRRQWSNMYEPIIGKYSEGRIVLPQSELQLEQQKGARVHLWTLSKFGGDLEYYISNLGPNTNEAYLADIVRNRWIVSDYNMRLKSEFGLNAYQGRSWVGLNRHLLMVCLAAVGSDLR